MEHIEKCCPKSISPTPNDPNNDASINMNPNQNVDDDDDAKLEDGTSSGGEKIFDRKTPPMSKASSDSILECNYKRKISEGCEVSTNLYPPLRKWKCVKIFVRFSKKKFPIQAALESSVQTFKNLIAQNCDICVQQQLLIYKGRILKDDQTLQSYGLEADHAVYLICRSTPADTNAKGAGGGNDEEQFLEDEELPIRELSDLGPLADEPIMHNLTNIIEILRHLAINHPELQELMQQHPELAYIYNGPRDQIVVSSMPNTTPLPNPWTPTITGWRDLPDLEDMEDDRARLNAGLSTLTRLMHYPSIYQMILDILSDPEALRQIPVAVTDYPYMEFISLREAMQGLEQFYLISRSMSSQQFLNSQRALPSQSFESESEESGEDDGDTGN